MEFGGEKGKGRKDPQQVPHDARTPTTKGRRRENVYLTSVGSAALPESEASNYTYTKVQRKTTEGTREKTEGRGETRERENEEEEREPGLGSGVGSRQGVESKRARKGKRQGARGKRAETGWSCAYDRGSCHVTGRGNQSAPVS